MKKKRVWRLLTAMLLLFIMAAPTIQAQEQALLLNYEVLENGTARITEYNGLDECWIVPETVDGYTVTEIGECIALRNFTLKTLVLPDTVEVIGISAFQECSLETVYLSKNLKEIREAAFFECSDLKQVVIPSTVTVVEPMALGYVFFSGPDENGYFVVPGIPGVDPNMTLIIDRNETAKTYAETNGVAYRMTNEFQSGDVDFDGTVDTADARLLLREFMYDYAKPTLVSDMNGNHTVDTSDVRLILQKAITS